MDEERCPFCQDKSIRFSTRPLYTAVSSDETVADSQLLVPCQVLPLFRDKNFHGRYVRFRRTKREAAELQEKVDLWLQPNELRLDCFKKRAYVDVLQVARDRLKSQVDTLKRDLRHKQDENMKLTNRLAAIPENLKQKSESLEKARRKSVENAKRLAEKKMSLQSRRRYIISQLSRLHPFRLIITAPDYNLMSQHNLTEKELAVIRLVNDAISHVSIGGVFVKKCDHEYQVFGCNCPGSLDQYSAQLVQNIKQQSPLIGFFMVAHLCRTMALILGLPLPKHVDYGNRLPLPREEGSCRWLMEELSYFRPAAHRPTSHDPNYDFLLQALLVHVSYVYCVYNGRFDEVQLNWNSAQPDPVQIRMAFFKGAN